MLVYMMVVQPDYVMPMFREPLGWAILAGGAMLLAFGAFVMSRIVKVEV